VIRNYQNRKRLRGVWEEAGSADLREEGDKAALGDNEAKFFDSGKEVKLLGTPLIDLAAAAAIAAITCGSSLLTFKVL